MTSQLFLPSLQLGSASDCQEGFLEVCQMPSLLKFFAYQFHVSSGLQVLDPFVRDHSPLALSPGPLSSSLHLFFISSNPFPYQDPWEPSIWPPFHFCFPSHRLSLPCTMASYYSHFLGCPLAFSPSRYTLSALPQPWSVTAPLPWTHTQPAGKSGPFLLQWSY